VRRTPIPPADVLSLSRSMSEGRNIEVAGPILARLGRLTKSADLVQL